MTQAERVLAALKGGPKRVSEISVLTGIPSAQAARACSDLVDKFAITRVAGGGRGAPCIYALRGEGAAYSAAMKGDVMRELEAAYVAARSSGLMAKAAAAHLELTQTAALSFEIAFRAQTTSASARDSSCPKFAEHDHHLGALASLGGFPVLPRLADLQGARA